MIVNHENKKAVLRFLVVLFICVVSVFVVGFGGIEANAATSGDYTYTVLSDGTVEITDYTGSDTTLSIPSEIDGKVVTSIGNYAFKNCSCLINIIISDNVTRIGYDAFLGCSSLTNVTIPDSVKSINNRAFIVCTRLTNIEVDSNNGYYKSINGILFSKDLTQIIKYPDGKPEESFIIPNSVTDIGNYAFRGCSNLINITISDNVTSIGNNAFYCCSGLTNIIIPNNITSIGDDVFSGCDHLTSITIPDSIKRIGYMAFYNCNNLTDVYYTGTEEQWNNITKLSFNSDLTSANIHYNYVIGTENVGLSIPSADVAKQDVTINFDYSDNIFANDSSVYNHELSKLSSIMATSAYWGDDDTPHNNRYALRNLVALGFNKASITDYGSYACLNKIDKNDCDYEAYTFGMKELDNGQKIIAVIIKGTSANEEWFSNFNVWEDKNSPNNCHYGFTKACERLEEMFFYYVSGLGITDFSNIKIWITGHSRGAAVGNIFAAHLDKIAAGESAAGQLKQSMFSNLSKSNIYSYLYATPSVERNISDKLSDKYNNIFNFVNPQDFVPRMPLQKWGYEKYGRVLIFPNEVSQTNSKYKEFINAATTKFKELFNGADLNKHLFKEGTSRTIYICNYMHKNIPTVSDYYNKLFFADPSVGYYTLYHFENEVNPPPELILVINQLEFILGQSSLGRLAAMPPLKPYTAEDFFKDGICNAAIDNKMNKISGISILLNTPMYPFKDIFFYFVPGTIIDKTVYYSHTPETYIAGAYVCDSLDDFAPELYYNIEVKCPVDVEIYDSNNNLVGRVVDNQIDEDVTTVAIYVDDSTNSKYIYGPADETYTVKAIGYDSGTMDYSVSIENIDDGTVQESYSVDDIPIAPESEVVTDPITDDGVVITATNTSENHSDYVIEYVVGSDNNVTMTENEVIHKYSSDWSFDEKGHWHLCDCGKRDEYSEHSSLEKCEICGYTCSHSNCINEITHPTEISQGYTTHTCVDCGNVLIDSYTDYETITLTSSINENGDVLLSWNKIANNLYYEISEVTNGNSRIIDNTCDSQYTVCDLPAGSHNIIVTALFADNYRLYSNEVTIKIIKPAFKGHNLVLSGKIGVNFYMELPDGDYSDSYMEFNINGNKQIDYIDYADTYAGLFNFTCYVTSVEIADNITAVFHYGDKTVESNYTVEKYLNVIIENKDGAFDESTVELAKSIADYGHYIQPFLAEENNWIIGDKHNATAKATEIDDIAIENALMAVQEFAFSKDLGTSDIDKIGYSLVLDSDTKLCLYLIVKDGYSGNVTAMRENNIIPCEKQSDGSYLISISGISAHKLGNMNEITVNTDSGVCIISVSAISYVNTVLKSTAENLNTMAAKQAVTALYNYYAATLNYKNNH